MTWRAAILSLYLLASTAQVSASSAPDEIVGVASVIDGDTLEIRGQRIRLYGVDAPESRQLCDKVERQYRCGQAAALALADKIGQATVRCDQRDIDRYRRIVAICRVGAVDLNAWIVRQGWAVAYREYASDYVDEEIAAQSEKLGIWAGRFVIPSDWRRGVRVPAVKDGASNTCQIKGNINSKGARVYHVPGGQDYVRTRIDENKGERWFCSEKEALDAGWQRSLR